MKILNKIKTYSLIATLIMVSACSDDFLNEEIRSDFTPETLNDELGYQAQIIGLYQMLSTWQTRSGQQGWLAVWQVGTDVVWPTQPEGIEIPWFKYNQLNTDDNAANQSWELWYNMVENSNSIIYSIENNPPEALSNQEQNAINAEARFFRALAYNNLATLFGGVPLILEPVTEARFDYIRNPIEEINEQIAVDLEYATANLDDPSVSPQLESRVNKYVAHQLFTEYYLRIGDPMNAEKQANIILNSGKFSLITSRYGVKASEQGTPFSDMFFCADTA